MGSTGHATRPDRALVDVFVPAPSGSAALDRAQRFVSEGVIAHPGLPDLPYAEGACWTDPLPRTHARYVHGMLFVADWHHTLLAQADPSAAVDTLADLFLRWSEVVATLTDTSMAYHDETTAQRLMQIVRFLDDHGDSLDPPRREALVGLASSTASLLLDESFHGGPNNHGMFQDLTLLRYAAGGAWLPAEPDVDEVVRVALTRLVDYFTVAFAKDGVHVENSPGYHLMVARFLRDVLPVMQSLMPDQGKTLEAIYRGAQRFAVHSILPNGKLAPLGDTKVVRVRDTVHRTTFSGPGYKYAISERRQGRPPRERTAVFPHGGYAFHRTSWRDPDAYVVGFKAAYLSQYHHHNDDLALTVFGKGRWLLTEAGPYGYDYASPLTKYAFSQFAHNVALIDGRSLPRVDSEPQGVTLRDLAEPDGKYRLRVRGINERYRDARHSRGVVVREPQGNLEVAVADTFQPVDRADHDFTVLWHVGPELETVLHGDGAALWADGVKVLELTWSGQSQVAASIVTPRETGSVQAMRFPEFGRHEPATVIQLRSRGPRLSLRTIIRNGNWAYDS